MKTAKIILHKNLMLYGCSLPQHDSDPLGSDDDIDVGSEKSEEDFETQDSVICQWEKVSRILL